MITIIGRRLIIPDCDRVLGTNDEANTRIKLKLSEDTVEKYFPEGVTSKDVNVTLVMETESGASFPSIAFVWVKDGVHEGYVNLVNKSYTGIVKARALLTYGKGDAITVSMQTEEDFFLVTDDIDGSGVNAGGSEYTAWNALLTDIKAETSKITATEKSLEETVTAVSGYALSAEESAKNANNAYQDSKELKDSLEGTLTMASESAKNASNAENGATAARNAAKTYSETAMGHSASAQYYSEEALKYSKNAEAFKEEAEGAVTDAEGIKAQVETLKADVIKESENVAKRVTEAVSAKDATLRVVGDIDKAIDAILALQDELLPKAELG